MPIYEYRAKEDGAVVELVRPAAQADAPVEDPEGKGRTFERVLSTFAARGGTGSGMGAGMGDGFSLPRAGCCPCGDPSGPCNN